MKRLLLFLSIIITISVGVDVLLDISGKYYASHYKLPGDYSEIDYLIKESDEDIIILGSSVALNGINPNLLVDSLGFTCYNGGANAQFITYYETMLKCICTHPQKPKLLLLGLLPTELSSANFGRFDLLIPYYKNGYESIDRKLEERGELEPFLLKSSLYRYNTIGWRILLYHFIDPGLKDKNGFTGKAVPAVFPTMTHDQAKTTIKKEAVAMFESMVQTCKKYHIKLLVFIPPHYRQVNGVERSILYLEKYCKEKGIPFYDDSQNEVFLHHQEWFYDNVHVNVVGCDEYSKMMVPRIRKILQN